MIRQVFCAGCGSGGRLPLSLVFSQVYKVCDTCRNEDTQDFSYHFCGVPCFFNWTKHRNGLPCESCRGTGNAHGFTENGRCRHCNGTTLITSNRIELVPATTNRVE